MRICLTLRHRTLGDYWHYPNDLVSLFTLYTMYLMTQRDCKEETDVRHCKAYLKRAE